MAHSPAYGKTPKPTLAQIEAAKKAEAEKKKLADAAAAKLSKANLTLKQLTAVANAARAKYEAAKEEEMKIPWKEAQEGLSVPEDQYQERFWRRRLDGIGLDTSE